MYTGDGRRTQSAWYAPGDRYATCTTDGGSVAARSSRPLGRRRSRLGHADRHHGDGRAAAPRIDAARGARLVNARRENSV